MFQQDNDPKNSSLRKGMYEEVKNSSSLIVQSVFRLIRQNVHKNRVEPNTVELFTALKRE